MTEKWTDLSLEERWRRLQMPICTSVRTYGGHSWGGNFTVVDELGPWKRRNMRMHSGSQGFMIGTMDWDDL